MLRVRGGGEVRDHRGTEATGESVGMIQLGAAWCILAGARVIGASSEEEPFGLYSSCFLWHPMNKE